MVLPIRLSEIISLDPPKCRLPRGQLSAVADVQKLLTLTWQIGVAHKDFEKRRGSDLAGISANRYRLSRIQHVSPKTEHPSSAALK